DLDTGAPGARFFISLRAQREQLRLRVCAVSRISAQIWRAGAGFGGADRALAAVCGRALSHGRARGRGAGHTARGARAAADPAPPRSAARALPRGRFWT